MINRELEKKILQLKECLQLLEKFRSSYSQAISSKGATPEQEKEFLEVKSLLARRYQTLMEKLGETPSAEDRTFDLISQFVSLKAAETVSEIQFKKIESDWHNSYLSLNKIIGRLESEKEELSRVSAVKTALKKIFLNPVSSLILLALAIILIFFLFAGPIKELMQSFMPAKPAVTENNMENMKGGERK